MFTINDLGPGDSGLILKINAPEDIRQRFMDLGLIEGARVEMMCCAPLGDPILIRVFGTNLALRRHEADTIAIDGITGGGCSAGRKRHCRRAGWKSKLREKQPL